MTSATANSSSINGDRIPPQEKVSNDSRGLIALLCGMLLLGYIVLREMIGGGDLPPIETPLVDANAASLQQPSAATEPTSHALRPVGPTDGLLVPAPTPGLGIEGELSTGDMAGHEELSPLFAPLGDGGQFTPAEELLPPNPLRLGNRPDDTRWR